MLEINIQLGLIIVLVYRKCTWYNQNTSSIGGRGRIFLWER